MATKKPIVLYGGLMKQLQTGDTTPGQDSASEALSFAESMGSANSMAASEADAHASVAESVARALDLTGTASEAMSVAERAQSIGVHGTGRASEATSMADRASSLARDAVEITDISEAASLGKYGRSIARIAEDRSSEATSISERGSSLARDAAASHSEDLEVYSEAVSNAMDAHSEGASVCCDSSKSIGTRAESLGRAEGSMAVDYASDGLSEAAKARHDLSVATSEATYNLSMDASECCDASKSIGTRAESLGRAESSEAQSFASSEVDDLSAAVESEIVVFSEGTYTYINSLSEAVESDANALSTAVKSEANVFSVATSESFKSMEEYVSEAILTTGDDSSEGISYAISVGEHAYSIAVIGEDRSSEATSISERGQSLARLAQTAEQAYSISFGQNREGKLVYMTGIAGQVDLVNASNESKMPAIGIITEDIETTVMVRQLPDIYPNIKVDSDANPVVGADLFVSTIETGKISNNAPSTAGVVQRVGSAYNSLSEGNISLNYKLDTPVIL